MKTKRSLRYLIIAVTIGMFLTACKKKEDGRIGLDSDTSGATDNALAQGTFNDASNISDQGAAGNSSSYSSTNEGSDLRGILSQCATITRTSNGSTHRVIIDFGPTDCLCTDGRKRRGSIIIDFSGQGTLLEAYNDSLSANKHIITFYQYYVNDNHVEGTHVITNNGHNSNGHLNYTIEVAGGKITKPNGGGVVNWQSFRTREWIEGEGTSAFDDDVYLINGNASGTQANGTSFTETATNLKIAIGCPYIKSGVLQFTPSGKPVRSIDFGNGTCDANATVTISGHVFNIVL
jgi:hypothetical protein